MRQLFKGTVLRNLACLACCHFRFCCAAQCRMAAEVGCWRVRKLGLIAGQSSLACRHLVPSK